MTYAELVARIEALATVRLSESPEFASFLPGAIEAAELRCYRDCDFPSARRRQTVQLAQGVQTVAPPGDLVVPRSLYVTVAVSRSEVLRRDASYLREYAPVASVQGVPRYWATTDAGTIELAPAASGPCTLEMEYTYRPAPLSATNAETWLSQRYPDLLLYGLMVLVAGYQKNFGQQADDPQMPGSWERLYQGTLATARNEAALGKGWGAFDRTPAPPPVSGLPAG